MGDPAIHVTRTYLEMRSLQELRPSFVEGDDPRVERLERCPVDLFRFLYREVGRAYRWTDRLNWSDAEIREHLRNPNVSLWLLKSEESPAGYFELRHEDDSVEIAYFGLLPEYIGKGWGKFLLTRAVEEAWRLGPERVWLHTCTLDHPSALPNYLKRGFRPFREEEYRISG